MPKWQDVLIGPAAGLAGGQALARVAQMLYDRTSPENQEREQEIEPRTPFIVLTQKVAARLGLSPSPEAQKSSEKAIMLTLSMVIGTAYVAAARRWPLGWLAGGALFGTLFWLVEDEGMGPALGLVGENRQYPAEAHLRGLAAHIAFGVTAAAVAGAFGVTPPERA